MNTCFIDFTSSYDFSAPVPAISFVNLGYTVCAYASASGSRAVPRPNRQNANNRSAGQRVASEYRSHSHGSVVKEKKNLSGLNGLGEGGIESAVVRGRCDLHSVYLRLPGPRPCCFPSHWLVGRNAVVCTRIVCFLFVF